MRPELHILASHRGATRADEPSDCAICGESPFPAAGPKGQVLGPNFTSYEHLGAAPDICAGCQSLLAGKPGSEPPPLRMCSVLATDEKADTLDRPAFWEALETPPNKPHVLSWATSKKQHHYLNAGLSSRMMQRIGSDAGVIDHDVDGDRELRHAVRDLLRGPKGKPLFSRTAVESGDYHPKSVAAYGIAEWQRLESIVARRRPCALLSLICWCAPAGLELEGAQEEPTEMLDPIDRLAVELIADLAEGSERRREDGKAFWGGELRRRLERIRGMSLGDAVSRLMDDLRVNPLGLATQAATARVAEWDEETEKGVCKALSKRASLVVALARNEARSRTEAAKAAKESDDD